MASIWRFRSLWGVEPGQRFENWEKLFPSLKSQGYAGVEIDIAGLQDLHGVRQLCEKLGLEVTAHIYTSWPKYKGRKPAGLGLEYHLNHYRSQLELAKILKPIKINSQSGNDQWSLDEAVEFFQGTLTIDFELGLEGKICHETHRNRCLYSPYAAAHILNRVPSLRITADFSHFVVVCERLLDIGEDDKKLLSNIIPHVNHIHARIGTTQSSQCPDPTHPVFNQEREFFENVWKQIIEVTQSSDQLSTPITFVPEYGPYPYHPFGSVKDFSEVADSEGHRLQNLFEGFANCLRKRVT